MNTTGIRFIDELDLKEKTVFIRCDFNVPLDKDGNITDDTRIRAALPTITRALEGENTKVILASHLGRPKGEYDARYSMVPVGQRLSELLGYEVIIPEDVMDPHVDTLLENLATDRQVILLENLRFHPGEKKNDRALSSRLASLANVYVNDAFGTAHRAHASTYGMVEHFDQKTKARVGGYLLRAEIEQLGALLERPERPFIAVMGGAKVSDKLGVLLSLVDRVQGVIIGGAMAYTFLKAQGIEVGNSRVEEELLDDASAILKRAAQSNVTIHLPLDHVIVEKFEDEKGITTPDQAIPEGMMALDIGPKTRQHYATVLAARRPSSGTARWACSNVTPLPRARSRSRTPSRRAMPRA